MSSLIKENLNNLTLSKVNHDHKTWVPVFYVKKLL